MNKIADANVLAKLLQSLEGGEDKLTPIQKLQKDRLRDWLKEDSVPSAEFIQFTRGLIAPADQENYFILLGSAMVCFPFNPPISLALTRDPLATLE